MKIKSEQTRKPEKYGRLWEAEVVLEYYLLAGKWIEDDPFRCKFIAEHHNNSVILKTIPTIISSLIKLSKLLCKSENDAVKLKS